MENGIPELSDQVTKDLEMLMKGVQDNESLVKITAKKFWMVVGFLALLKDNADDLHLYVEEKGTAINVGHSAYDCLDYVFNGPDEDEIEKEIKMKNMEEFFSKRSGGVK